ncbi:hypothetical protein D1815_22960 [Aquimarina sp. AD1]|uniref:hypothetical protein n=1 Tax=Aquimarina TaxID=290174 RepID=UPI0004263D85|nr:MULTISPECIES: hypothetical protein [Aquimarina]AXT58475.1 hypothetical protein D1815_22960 [Aquimarina sp. AD1]RKN16022.1 hypothetical protein D7035_15805 [Aquimarina sp. AD1]
MLQNILNVKGVQTMNKQEQQLINGGFNVGGFDIDSCIDADTDRLCQNGRYNADGCWTCDAGTPDN